MMARRNSGLNKYQKGARRPGECRVDREDIKELLELSRSDNPKDRAIAAELLCPCHVRRRIDAVWEALYRMLEDPNHKVRRTAWHTLDDGGCPDDPQLDEIIERTLQSETDTVVRRFAQQFSGSRAERVKMRDRLAMRSEFTRRGKCDFCARHDVPVKIDFDTPIPSDGTRRAAWICQECEAHIT